MYVYIYMHICVCVYIYMYVCNMQIWRGLDQAEIQIRLGAEIQISLGASKTSVEILR